MDNPCPAHIGCAGDCNECSYIGDDDMYKQMKEMFEKCQAYNIKLQAELKLYKRALDDLIGDIIEFDCSRCDFCEYLRKVYKLDMKKMCTGDCSFSIYNAIITKAKEE